MIFSFFSGQVSIVQQSIMSSMNLKKKVPVFDCFGLESIRYLRLCETNKRT